MHLEEIIFSNKTQTYIMKKFIFMILTIIMVAGLTSKIKAQTQNKATATTTAGAEIIAAISITSGLPLNFGLMSSPNADVEVNISTTGIVSTLSPTAISLFPSTATNAHYSLSGATGYTYAITLPADDQVEIKNGTNIMAVEKFTALVASKGSIATTGTLLSGSDSFVVGATLKVKTAQPIGAYTGNFEVIVTYN